VRKRGLSPAPCCWAKPCVGEKQQERPGVTRDEGERATGTCLGPDVGISRGLSAPGSCPVVAARRSRLGSGLSGWGQGLLGARTGWA